MEGVNDILNEAFDIMEYDDVKETISVSDVIAFFQAVRAASDDKITELCNYLDDTADMEFTSLIKLIQDFAEERRNSFSGESDDLVGPDSSNYQNTTGNLEGCGGDVSTIEPDLGELLLRNKNLSHSNTNLRAENSELRKQLDAFEDECETQRGTIAALDKDLKHFQGSKPDVQLLLKEKDELQTRMQSKEEEVLGLIHREKVLKEESEDYRLRLSCLQDQYDSVSIIIDHLRKENMEFEQEINTLKGNCAGFQLNLESKDEQLALKTKECLETTEKIQELEGTIKDLQEEKEALSVQVREMQFEYSICQKAVTGSAPGTPVRISIQHELNQADDGIGENDYPSPICGTNYVKGNKQPNSPLTENLRKGLLTSIIQSPPSPRQQQDRRSLCRPEPFTAENSTQTNVLDLTENQSQTCILCLSEAQTQTIKKEISEFALQTECKEIVEKYIQTEEIEVIKERKDILAIEEEDKMFEVQSSMIEDGYKDQIVILQQNNEDLKMSLDREKSKSQYLTTQVGANRAKIQGLHEELGKEQEKVTVLTDINIKLCSSKLDMWWDDSQKTGEKGVGGQEMEAVEERIEEHTSQLIDALSLASIRTKKIMQSDSDILHGQDISQADFVVKSDAESYKQITLAGRIDKTTLCGRSSILENCKDMIEQAIKKKVDLLLEMMREVVFSDDYIEYENICVKRNLNTSFSNQLMSLQALSTKLGKVEHDIGARKEERKMSAAVKVLTDRLSTIEKKCSESQKKLCQLFGLSLECQCFTAINMLSVLKDIEHEDEFYEQNIQLHSKRSKEVVNFNGSLIQSQIAHLRKSFDQLDDSLAGIFGRNLPTKKWLMMMCFLLFSYLTFQWEDYHVPPIV